jgi:ribosomal protein L12E/L44/L45/RPP1/RPP2
MTLRNLQGVSVDELAQEYEQAAVAYGQALAAANHRAANRAHDRIASAYRELRRRAAASPFSSRC